MAKKIGVGVLIFLGLLILFNFGILKDFVGTIFNALYPVFIGLIIALMLNTPVKLLEKTLYSSPKLAKLRRTLSLATVIVVFLGIIVLLGFLLAPEIIKSVELLKNKLDGLSANSLRQLLEGSQFFYELAGKLEKPIDKGIEALVKVLPTFLSSTFNTIINFFIGVMFGILIITNKEGLYRQLNKLLFFVTSEVKACKIMASLWSASDKFSKFMSGQLLEAFIFGTACYVIFAIFKVPYAALIALVMAVANLIPILGAYIGGILSFLIILTASPEKAVTFAIIIIIMQQIEQFTTYPIIVGRYVGISAFWVMFSVTVGGSLFGFWGLILSVPLVAFMDNFFTVISEKKIGGKSPCPL